MPAAFARSAIALPTAAAAVDVAGALEAARARPSARVEAHATTTCRFGVDDLRVDVLRRAVHAQARCTCSSRILARPRRARRRRLAFLFHRRHALLLLRFLAARSARRRNARPCPCRAPADGSARISAATWPTCCRSAPLTRISVWLGVSIVMPSGTGVHDRVRETERQVQLLALRLRAIADADQLELPLEALASRPSPCSRGARAVEPACISDVACCARRSRRARASPSCDQRPDRGAGGRLSAPLAPLTVTDSPSTVAVTPLRQRRPASLQLVTWSDPASAVP